MGVLNCYLKHRQAESTGDFTTIYDFTDITIRRKMEAKTNSIKITLPNKFSKYSGKYNFPGFKEEDEIYIYAHWGPIVEANHLIMSSTVKEVGYITSGKKRNISLNCLDRTYQLLNKLYFGRAGFDYADGFNAPEAIEDIVKFVSTVDSRENKIKTSTYIETTPTGGTTFDDVSLSLNKKTAYEWIQNLSDDPHTRYDAGSKSDRPYIFWIDKDNEFHWVYPAQTGGTSIVIGQNNDFQVKLDKSTFDVINLIFFNVGKAPDGNGIEWYYYDQTSKQPELRSRYQPMIDIARDMQDAEKRAVTFTGEYPDSYPHTTLWNEEVANDAGYLGTYPLGTNEGTGFIGESVKRAINECKKITKRTGDLRWKGSFTMRGTVSYNPGDLLKLTYNDGNMVDKKLRCTGVEHQIKKGGWSTIISVEEDVKALTS
jgi:hypothetical protein